ncbi:MAG: type II secretion system protein [Candidatus Paceibacterota bacterium]
MKFFYQKAFTLIEILVVIAILMLLISIALPEFSKLRKNQILIANVSNIISLIEKAKNQTSNSLNGESYGVYFTNNSVTLFEGTVYDAEDSNLEILNLDPGVTLELDLSEITAPGSGENGDPTDQIYFHRLTNQVSGVGSLNLSIENHKTTKNIHIEPFGVITILNGASKD